MHRLHPLILGLAGSLLILPLAAEAGAPTDQLRAASEKVIRILDDPALKSDGKALERQAGVRAAVADLFDFNELSRRALGRHWRPLSEAEREEFVLLFRTLLERTYLPRIRLYQGERVRFVGESVDGDAAAVQARVLNRRDQEVPVIFRLNRRGEHWLIFDVSVEGISLVSNYRAQFDQIIQRASYQGLVTRIRQKLATGDAVDEAGFPAATKPK
ncbi:MAG: ABC transporter substrate-binding protein [Candidatus Rokubacteria bacterium]|nr:ABC transporter substrate-binding protein [Candidatus Rokubacteria bacterium]